MIDAGSERVPREDSIKQVALNEQLNLVSAMTTAATVQDSAIEHMSETRDQSIGVLRHIVSILGAMLDSESREQSADEQLRASQKISRPMD